MPIAPDPDQIYDRARHEGSRRLSEPALKQASTAFIAGVTIVFGIVALGMAHALVAPAFGEGPAQLAGALAFAIGLVFLVVGRSELFTENFFDPVAAAAHEGIGHAWRGLLQLWIVVLVLNLVGGAVMTAIFSVEGTLPAGAREALATVAEEIVSKGALATFTRAIVAGTLLTLLSYLLHGVDSVVGRISLAYMVGFFVALGPFDHVVVSGMHLLLGVWVDAHGVGYGDLGLNMLSATAGNLLGGLLLMTLTHAVQEWSS